jgi:hypothetical protein
MLALFKVSVNTQENRGAQCNAEERMISKTALLLRQGRELALDLMQNYPPKCFLRSAV